MEYMDRNTAIAEIKSALKARSGRTWSVRGGKGTAWGWIRIHVPPARRNEYGYMSEADRAELARLLGKDTIHSQGESIPASSDYYREYVARAKGTAPAVYGKPYWD